MKILAIETSCDETAIAILEAKGKPHEENVHFNVLSSIVLSQATLHAKYGGVYPSLAKREHSRNLVPVLEKALLESNFLKPKAKNIPDTRYKILDTILEREPELLFQLKSFLQKTQKPDIDHIAVTNGPGLEPSLWVGINFAKALSHMWDIPLIPTNHMEGHFFSALLEKNNSAYDMQKVSFPILGLLISGGHTELVLSRDWLQYEIIGETRDDAAGEAFDKVARMLGLEYPGGPAIAREAAKWHGEPNIKLPRPMLDSGDFDFSFSGLKTAVLYQLKATELTTELIHEFAYEFQEAVADVLVKKTIRAAKKYGVKMILSGGGVSANERIKKVLTEKTARGLRDVSLFISPSELTGDNAVMIAVAAYINIALRPQKYSLAEIHAEGTLRLGK